MELLRKFFTLRPSDQVFLGLVCIPAVGVIRLALTFLPYQSLKRLLSACPEKAEAPLALVRRVAWGVRNAARAIPGATCLTQALAAQFLLARLGYPSQIRIGVAKDSDGELLAHAWLLSNGSVVIGGSMQELSRYVVLTEISARSS